MKIFKRALALSLSCLVLSAGNFIATANSLNGWHKIASTDQVPGGDRYYVDGVASTGRTKVNNTTYLFDANGNKKVGWHNLECKHYYFDASQGGGMLTGKRKIGQTTYLLHNDGYKTYGWHRLEGLDYYFSPNYGGGMITGVRRFNNTLYVFNNAGYKQSGWHKIGNREYYFDPNLGNGATRIKENGVELRISDVIKTMKDEAITNVQPEKCKVVTTKQITETRYVPYKTISNPTFDMLFGEVEVIQDGTTGIEVDTIEITYENGVEVSRKVISTETTRKAIDNIIKVGSRKEYIKTTYETIEYKTVEIEDPNLSIGERKVVQEGQYGSKTIVSHEVYDGDKFVSSTIESETITDESVDEIVHIGTGYNVNDLVNKTYAEGDVLNNGFVYVAKRDSNITGYYADLDAMDPEELYRLASTGEENALYYVGRNIETGKNTLVPLPTDPYVVEKLNDGTYVDSDLFNQELAILINQERASKGLNPLKVDMRLSNTAIVRASELAEHGHTRFYNPDTNTMLSHVRDAQGTSWIDAVDKETYNQFLSLGENVLMNAESNPYARVSEKYLAEKVFNQWKNSPSHYANMMTERFDSTYTDLKFTQTIRVGATLEQFEDYFLHYIAAQILGTAE